MPDSEATSVGVLEQIALLQKEGASVDDHPEILDSVREQLKTLPGVQRVEVEGFIDVLGILLKGTRQSEGHGDEAAEALNESEEHYRRVMDSAPDGFAVYRDGEFLFVNAALTKILGAERAEELVGRPVLDVIHPDGKEVVSELIGKASAGELTPGWVEAKALRIDGEAIDVEVAGTTIKWKGRPARQVQIRDITDRIRAQGELRKSEGRWRSLTESSPSHVMLLGLDYTIQFINRTVPDIDREEVIGRSCLDFVPADYRKVATDCFERVIELAQPAGYETLYLGSGGEAHYFDVRIGPVMGEDGSVIGFVSSSIDITERGRGEQALKASERRAHALLEGVPDMVFRLDRRGCFWTTMRMTPSSTCSTWKRSSARAARSCCPPKSPILPSARSLPRSIRG